MVSVDVRVHLLDEQCCEDGGVPDECMGLCTPAGRRRDVQDTYETHNCEEHMPTIEDCAKGTPTRKKILLLNK